MRPLPAELLKQEWLPEQFTNEEIDSAFEYSLDIIGREKRPNVVAAKIMYFIHAGQLERAKREVDHARSQRYSFDSDLVLAEKRVAEEIGSVHRR